MQTEFQVISTCGNLWLGGSDINEDLFQYFADKFSVQAPDHRAMTERDVAALRKAVESIKEQFTGAEEVPIRLNFDGFTLKDKMSRAQFAQLITPRLQQTFELVKSVLQESHIPEERIKDILLVGGSTKIPVSALFTMRMFMLKRYVLGGRESAESALSAC